MNGSHAAADGHGGFARAFETLIYSRVQSGSLTLCAFF